MATYAVGDIQGCFDAFQRLLEECRFDATVDCLWLVGDLVNRGPRSLDTLRFVRDLGASAITVLGNHDLYLLMAAAGFGRRSKGDTLEAILNAPDRDELLDWLRCQRLCHHAGRFCLVHAGLLPQWTVAKARALAREVEDVLGGPDYLDFMRNMWGSEPVAWSDDLTGWPRLRVIVNAMTRMRFCSPEGEMEFRTKGEASAAPEGFVPWFEVAGRQSADHVLVTGHWSALGLRMEANLLALDSGCLWGRHLTAVRLEDRALFQVGCPANEART
ncbi:MAG: symmetrical bis(5'-nucleosyl)-tetraphosphatase [Candidatus Accumulibacter sp.]|uniref:symmetrical bis(5'-nucleosyl)-tetraphosphatase n=1 Tax=Accumulibacter sp. TaxID=2053492 RepID=UPI00287875D8|nr:symmetrical bis(5'-nucleosyl)-tetraphosphatase [Accumulibacter sp.]MDS4013925.1 symmetrical bis(5'-nucleosyl)-tetraphosphatase [Accumulibacter sp.]